MAFFNKLFFQSSNKGKATTSTGRQRHYLSQFPFHTNQVRVLLYRECDNRGRRLLFDSNALEKVDLKENSKSHSTSQNIHSMHKEDPGNHNVRNQRAFSETSSGFFYRLGRPKTDITGIGEIVFGALAMSFRGTSLKVHWLKSPTRIMCSQVFLSPAYSNGFLKHQSSGNLRSNQSMKDHSTTDDTSTNSCSMPFPVCINKDLSQLTNEISTNSLYAPYLRENSERTQSGSTEDSGYNDLDLWSVPNSSCCQYIVGNSLTSIFNYPENMRKLSLDSTFGDNSSSNSSKSSSDSSIQRRISRNISTSFENRTSTSDFICFIGDNFQVSDNCITQYKQPNESDEYHNTPKMKRSDLSSGESSSSMKHNRHVSKRAKLGLALCITMTEPYETEMEMFCSEHIALLESMLCKLRAFVEKAYVNHEHFLQIMLNAWEFIARWIKDLFTAPRLPCPIWLSISTSGNKNSKSLADSFMKELCCLLSCADTKNTNFFISKVLTAVLTNHLGWVSTVPALKSKPKSQIIEIVNEINIKLFQVSQKHPYNSLWAQMGDLYGAIGNPPRISRTIIFGTKIQMVEKLLHILTYFIRSGEVLRLSENEVFNKESLTKLLTERKGYYSFTDDKLNKEKSDLKRTQTYVKNLSLSDFTDDTQNEYSDLFKGVKRNDEANIPNILTFQGSNYIQEELKLGNYLSNTRNESVSVHINEVKNNESTGRIQLGARTLESITVSKSANIENEDVVDSELLKKTLEFEGTGIGQMKLKEKYSTHSFWDAECSNDVMKVHTSVDIESRGIKESKSVPKLGSMSTISSHMENTKFKHLERNVRDINLPNIIVTGNIAKDEHLMWSEECTKEITPVKEGKHFEFNEKTMEKDKEEEKGVVFVLGENETLINIKKSTEDISSSEKTMQQINERRVCNHHKKHSGVKFNFEQYPQIATNYMKNKNLDISNYNFFEKSSKLDNMLSFEPSTSTFPMLLPKTEESSCEECEYCTRHGVSTLVTPSNATELEFETDDNYSLSLAVTQIEQKDNLKIRSANSLAKGESSIEEKQGLKTQEFSKVSKFQSEEERNCNLGFIDLPISGTKSSSQLDSKGELKSGFIPSLFLGINDYYIPDMVLQGTLSSPNLWEKKLQKDLTVSSHCASFNSTPMENVAIIADMEKWEVKMLSSRSNILPYSSNISGPVGMSQLVSTMLETVYAMNTSGVSSYECLLYIESKLQEIYLQSEALAAFLLATEFCSLSTVTSALNVSSNDVPLLLSVASVHSPQLTKTYGVSFS